VPADRNGQPFTGLTFLLGYPKHLHIQLKAIDLLFWPSFGRLALYYSVFKVRNLGYRPSEKDLEQRNTAGQNGGNMTS
jgi:hypothetical protein